MKFITKVRLAPGVEVDEAWMTAMAAAIENMD